MAHRAKYGRRQGARDGARFGRAGEHQGARHPTARQSCSKASSLAFSVPLPLWQAHGLQPVPWGGIAARLSPDAREGKWDVDGRPYCLLPLPATTGLPVHVNGFFELSSNRRDIWYGDDMVGAGRLRA
eukprot:3549704-Prymnesium_polylepis.1